MRPHELLWLIIFTAFICKHYGGFCHPKCRMLKLINIGNDVLLKDDGNPIIRFEGFVFGLLRDGLQFRAIYWWSLLDTSEWEFGYSICLGIFFVYYETPRLQRFKKESFYAWQRFLGGKTFQGSPMDDKVDQNQRSIA